ncbi:type IV pilus modification PilV family protein [Haloferula rosea]|uniref:Uncharacterized protein n=1 Tax=Haloferula rosea TaxID=490093 RepID=A0A934RBZ0_9BACT|nr:hypothetical protein [Haloferula rosea]MBK1826494.1 hypothetical protein [Haloferula rosea]
MNHSRQRYPRRGFTLAVVLVVMAAILLLAVGVLAVVGIERKTARSYIDSKRAEWIARAGMEDVRARLGEQTANDDYLIVSQPGEVDAGSTLDPLDYLFLVRGSGGGDDVEYELQPLFSSPLERRTVTDLSALPPVTDWSEPTSAGEMEVRPWSESARIAWIPVEDDAGKVVGRYGFWVEDLQARLDASQAGGDGRVEWPFPAPGVSDEEGDEEAVVSFHALDPSRTGDEESSELDSLLDGGREVLVSPESAVAALGREPGLDRDDQGRLEDPMADVVERSVVAGLRSYEELPIVPFSAGIDEALTGEPKLNLNELLGMERDRAVDEFARHVEQGLPEFDERGGGFPDDYLRTLAAGALDYADTDDTPTLGGSYRGLDAYPLLSEIFLRIGYNGLEFKDGRKYMKWEFQVFTEFWNMTSESVSGLCQVSYENGLGPTGIGVIPQGRRFDDPSLLDDPIQSTHNLEKKDGKYWSPSLNVSLEPDEYGVFLMATVEYSLDVGPISGPGSEFIKTFALSEPLGAAGMSLRWNDDEVARVERIVRSPQNLTFYATRQSVAVEAAIPGHSYGPYGDFVNNMGDPRIAHYIRNEAAGENAYPENASPGRRNVRRGTIYDRDSSTKPRHYGRVLPSEWPDGGHNSMVGSWNPGSDERSLPTDSRLIGNLPAPERENAVQRLSQQGRFYSAAELGRVFDPVMWQPAYADLPNRSGSGRLDTKTLLDSSPRMPTSRTTWPEVTAASVPSADYGGGNTLRIGRTEHQRFRNEEQHAVRLLDLFHAGKSTLQEEEERESPLVTVDGHVNLNTASEDAIRALVAGNLRQDPKIGRVLSSSHSNMPWMAPRTVQSDVGTPAREKAADLIAEAIIAERPFDSAYALAMVEDEQERSIWGNEELFDLGSKLRWTDAAAEELFARLWESSTLRSRNFRVWVIGQSIAPTDATGTAWRDTPTVLAESRKVFSLFADPGERDADGRIRENRVDVEILYENDF